MRYKRASVHTMRLRIRKERLICLGGIVLLLLVTIFIYWQTYEVLIPDGLDVSQYPPFEPEITEEFPTTLSKTPKIPHIIHQTFKDEMVYTFYVKYIKTFVDLNPDWEYYFWTDDSARKLIVDKYPHLLAIFDSFVSPIVRADILRYVVLFEYGGVYADLDFECLRNLDRMTFKYACIFPPEPFEMTSIVNNWAYFINNAFMACRPRHPFLKQILDNIGYYQVMEGLIDKAGPAFITSQFLLYNKLKSRYRYSTNYVTESNSPYFYKGELAEDHMDAVYVPNSKYFFNTLDNHGSRISNMIRMCNEKFEILKFNQRRACFELKRRFERPTNHYALAEHHWIRSYEPNILFTYYYTHFGKTHIKDVVKQCKIYSSLI